MAFVAITNSKGNLPFIYNVDMAVGTSAANKRDDVMLVQYCLKHIWANPTKFNPPLPSPPSGEMKVDGFCGPTTRRWIVEWQFMSRKRGHNVTTDGLVDKARGSFQSSISKTDYHIVKLNAALKRARPDLFKNIFLDPDAPAELKLAVGLVITPDSEESPGF